jgi:hypothetical protein
MIQAEPSDSNEGESIGAARQLGNVSQAWPCNGLQPRQLLSIQKAV